MNYLQSFAISASGMSLERTRVEVAARNLANANTVGDEYGNLYRPQRVVAQAGFASAVAHGLSQVEMRVESTHASPRRVHEPGHPLADDKGFVTYAGVDTAGEMVTLLGATRAYEANLAAFTAARQLALKALEIGA